MQVLNFHRKVSAGVVKAENIKSKIEKVYENEVTAGQLGHYKVFSPLLS
jgi:hypothetical protein